MYEAFQKNNCTRSGGSYADNHNGTVSYTHLDVYKRQQLHMTFLKIAIHYRK